MLEWLVVITIGLLATAFLVVRLVQAVHRPDPCGGCAKKKTGPGRRPEHEASNA